jgi:radical SAM superfamily enzyme YgiQ (UPF0313 family)
MNVHCTPPYRYDHPNAVLGYLKGFLEDRGIPVKNVYWNLVLYKELMNWEEKNAKYHPIFSKLDFYYTTTTFVCKHLLASTPPVETQLDAAFSTFLTKDEIAELVFSVKDTIDQYIREHKLHEAPLAGFTMKSYQWLMSHYIINTLKKMNPDIPVVIGGIVNEDQGRAFMRAFPLVDFAVYGEGEYPLYLLVEALQQGTDLSSVPQLLYRDNNRVITTPIYTGYADLDEYPFADHADYFDALHEFVPGFTRVLIPIYGSRSCPWNKCKFCVDNEEYTYRARSPEHIVEEIKYQSERHNQDTFTFIDSELPGNKNRFKALLKLLVQLSAERNEPYHFFGEVSPIFLDCETVNLMRLASFMAIQIGFEAVTDPLLKKMAKRQTFAHNIQALKLGKRYNLNVGGRFILREIPTETDKDILESCINLKFLRFFLKDLPLRPSLFVLYKGSAFYNHMSESERTLWEYNPFWADIALTGVIPEEDRFEFFGFHRKRPCNALWDTVEVTLNFYNKQAHSYRWIEYENGSFIEEKGPKTYQFRLDRDETDILIFCDLIKSFNEIKEKFSHIPDEHLCTILETLKSVGFIYYDKNMHTIISVLDAHQRKTRSDSS